MAKKKHDDAEDLEEVPPPPVDVPDDQVVRRFMVLQDCTIGGDNYDAGAQVMMTRAQQKELEEAGIQSQEQSY